MLDQSKLGRCELVERSPRLQWADNLKAIGIILVVFAHNPTDPRVTQLIYAFHMPLFFFLSGVFFNGSRYGFREYVVRKIQTRLKPYFFLSAVTFLFWVCVVIPLSVSGSAHQVDKLKVFLGIFYGIGTGVWRNQMATALWFLPCLFCVELIFYSIFKVARSANKTVFLYTLGVVLLGCLLNVYHVLAWRIPWSFDMALIALSFYAAGYLFTSLWKRIEAENFSLMNMGVVLAVLLMGVMLSNLNGRIDMSSYHIKNPLLFIVTPFFFILPFIYLFRRISSFWLDFLGKNTLLILAYHLIALFMIRSVVYLVTKDTYTFSNLTILGNSLLVVIEILILYPVIVFHNRYLGWALK